MHNAITSRHTRSASELFLMVPIKPGFVPISDVVMTYASRVSTVLSALYELRQRKLEMDIGVPTGPIELLQTINRVEWTVFETHDELRNAMPDIRSDFWTQIKGPQLLLTSHFTGSWEHYFYDLASIGGPLLDLIFSHCIGYDRHSCDAGAGYEAFSRFIRRHQRPCNFLYATESDLTVDDLRYFKAVLPKLAPSTIEPATVSIPRVGEEARALQVVIRQAAGLPVPTSWRPAAGVSPIDLLPGSVIRRDWTQSILNAVHALYEIRVRLFSGDRELTRTDGSESTGIQLFEDATFSLLSYEPDVDRLEAASRGVVPRRGSAEEWLLQLMQQRRAAEDDAADKKLKAPAPPPSVDRSEVQLNILESVEHTKAGAILLLSCADRAALSKLIVHMAGHTSLWPEGTPRADQSFVNFALTFVGIKRAELGQDVLEQFPREFQEGMEERAGSLGDIGAFNHPRFWQAPVRDRTGVSTVKDLERTHLSSVDAVVVLHAVDENARNEAIRAFESALPSGTDVLHRTNLQRGALDPFNLKDKISQPNPLFTATGSPRDSALSSPIHDTALGEFLLGYPDRNGRTAACAVESRNAESAALFKNSTFLVVRKMKQDKAAFDDYVKRVKTATNVTSDAQAIAFIVGRKADGSLRKALAAPGADPNEFDFKGDAQGAVCPLHAHVRRTNPRVDGTPRIMRRGYSYGPDTRDNGEQGVMFMAYNASIAEQYEILQRYVNGGNASGLSSLQSDLLCGANGTKDIPRWVSPSGNGGDFVRMPERPADKPSVVLRWGLYLFVPSKSGLAWLVDKLSKDARPLDAQDAIARGTRRMQALDALPLDLALQEWKRLLEESAEAGSAQSTLKEDIWAAIRHAGGVKRVSDTLVVVTAEKAARAVLSDDGSNFSVVEYSKRMRATIQDHYLAHDTVPPPPGEPSYADLSRIPNRELDTVTLDAFAEAFTACTEILGAPDDLEGELPGGKRSSISLRDLARAVVGVLCKLWFGMPDPPPPPPPGTYAPIIDVLERFLLTSRYTFQYDPGARLVADAQQRGSGLPALYTPVPKCPFAAQLTAANYAPPGNNVSVRTRQAVSGAIVGFAPPTVGALIRVLDQWIENEEFWRLRLEMRRFVENTGAQTPDRLKAEQARAEDLRTQVDARRTERADLNQAIYTALGLTPSPPILYRTALKPVRLSGVDILPDAKVVIALSSVYADACALKSDTPEAWLFGGKHGALPPNGDPPHGCPVRAAGTDVIAGVAAALFARKNLKRERRSVVSYDK